MRYPQEIRVLTLALLKSGLEIHAKMHLYKDGDVLLALSRNMPR